MKKEFKLIGIIPIIVIILCGVLFILGKTYIKHERYDDLYIKMKELNDSQSLIGLTKEEIVGKLGEPMKKYSSKDEYTYNAGIIYTGLILGNHNILTETNWYVLTITFDEKDIVKSTSMEYIP